MSWRSKTGERLSSVLIAITFRAELHLARRRLSLTPDRWARRWVCQNVDQDPNTIICILAVYMHAWHCMHNWRSPELNVLRNGREKVTLWPTKLGVLVFLKKKYLSFLMLCETHMKVWLILHFWLCGYATNFAANAALFADVGSRRQFIRH